MKKYLYILDDDCDRYLLAVTARDLDKKFIDKLIDMAERLYWSDDNTSDAVNVADFIEQELKTMSPALEVRYAGESYWNEDVAEDEGIDIDIHIKGEPQPSPWVLFAGIADYQETISMLTNGDNVTKLY